MSKIEETMALHILAEKLPEPVREYSFAKSIGRKWRFDFCWPELMLALECEGGTWSGGRHTRGTGYADDLIKYNEAMLMGWMVLRFTGDQVNNGTAINKLKEAISKCPPSNE